ncbi:hypothetical protein Ccrd_006767 [Cynara cardunculus var. scolymus]|uniref:Terpenoid cyclases/protein prenyltransferase alpha-alpha toroid n=1 Tax=Cynara cardunculus var. scolymus TaxID=59895 RepID=A0A124SBN7_CYNCS|nr:hypothetical protein Ccrd_006767 [Cynara cardunculus var. scolymus]
MWKLTIAEGNDPYLFSTNNFVGRQIWVFDPHAGTPAERQQVEDARQRFMNNRKQEYEKLYPFNHLYCCCVAWNHSRELVLLREESHYERAEPGIAEAIVLKEALSWI